MRLSRSWPPSCPPPELGAPWTTPTYCATPRRAPRCVVVVADTTAVSDSSHQVTRCDAPTWTSLATAGVVQDPPSRCDLNLSRDRPATPTVVSMADVLPEPAPSAAALRRALRRAR